MKILLNEKHDMIRYGFLQLLNDLFPVEYILEAEDLNKTKALLESYLFDYLLLNSESFARHETAELIRMARSRNEKVKVVLIKSKGRQADPSFLERYGINGVIGRDEPIEDLMNAFQEIDRGQIRYSFVSIRKNGEGKGDNVLLSSLLTQRENEVFKHLVRGYSVLESARELGVSSKTIENHRHNLRSKLNVSSHRELIKAAEETGYIRFKD
ncbi:hypothetical protein CR205_10055 [Alteribacter lacisalsi]|uniref:DNA-binding response regulator n=1 Tax=Alteribacter lacisalsi TaxID=2045244 RepID=A0A2W0HG33_9BACI|nr:response regulator transcription factor [Alteribacter lacisalsi]PYZ98890.1 hypothetical protein CR205_10055 [Alteribacter lacisalsi]